MVTLTTTVRHWCRLAGRHQCLRPGGWLAALLVLSSLAAQAQLSGAYTINSGAATGGTNYASFTAAAAALNTGGVSGPVTFTVDAASGPYNEQFTLNQFAGSSATNTVTFNGNGRTIQFAPTVSAARAVITFNGADFVTISNLVVDATVGGTSTGTTYGTGIQLYNSSNNVTLNGNTVIVSTTATTTAIAGIGSSNSQTSFTTAGAGASQNLTITNNTITGGYYGVITTGNSVAGSPTPGVVVSNNTVRDFYIFGIHNTYSTGAQIIGNDVARPTRTVVSTFSGIFLTTGVSGARVERNRVHQAFAPGATSTSQTNGIYLTTGTAATASTQNEVVNNLVYDLDGNGIVYALYNTGSFNRFYHNTVNISDQTNTSSSATRGFFNSGASGVEFINNIVQVTRSGVGDKHSVYHSTAAVATAVVSDYNDLTGSGTGYFVGYNGADQATLADWQAASGKDANSVSVTPGFVNIAGGNFTPTAPALDGAGTTLTQVPLDFTGATRTSPPDIGAIEFTVAGADIALVSIDAPVPPVAAGPRTVTVTVRNNGGTALTSVTLAYTLNGTTVTQTFTGLSVASGSTTQLSFTMAATLVTGPNTLSVTGTLPNGQTDPTPANNTQSLAFSTALAGGAYTINNLQPTAGTNFNSFTDAATALNGGGILGAVTITVSNGPYTEQFLLNEVPGTSATRRLVINGGNSTIQFDVQATSAQRSVVGFNGTDFVTLDGLVVNGAPAGATGTVGFGIQLYNNADNIILRNNTVTVSTSSTSTSFAGIVSSGSNTSATTTSPGANQNVTVENNTITGGYYGIALVGDASTPGLVARGNTVRDFYQFGIYNAYSAGAQIIGNDVARPTRMVVTTFNGIYLTTGVSGARVEANRVHQAFAPGATSTSQANGIYTLTGTAAAAGTENEVVNNLVYDLDGNGIVYALYNTGSFNRYYHNTVNINDQTNTSSSATRGFFNSGASGVEFINNIVQITRSGTGDKQALYFSTTAVAVATTSNYNDLTGTGADFVVARINSPANNYATLADWQANALAPGKDANSVSVAPGFASLNNLAPTSPALDGTGTTLAQVPLDFTGATRTSPPDIGAIEFTVAGADIALVSIDAPVTGAAFGPQTVTVTVRNNGGTALTSVTLAYTLNGGTAVTQTFTGLSVASGSTTQLSFTTQASLVTGSNTIVVTGSQPNGQTDPTLANNTQTRTVFTVLAGVYTINSAQPTAARNFASFSDAATALNNGGVSAAVTFNVSATSGPYTEQLLLEEVPGTSATNTITFNGNGRTIQFDVQTATVQRSVVGLNGTDFVTIDGLVVDGTVGGTATSTTGFGIQLYNNADNIIIRNNTVTVTQGTGTTSAGIVSSGSATSATTSGTNANQNVAITGNTVTGGYYGITLIGVSATTPGQMVSGNTVRDFYFYGIYGLNAAGMQIVGNDIARPTRTVVSTFNGIYLTTGINGANVERNRVHQAFAPGATSTSATNGIYLLAGATASTVVNNLVYDLDGNGIVYGLYNIGAGNRYYFNTVNITDQTNTSGSATRGFYNTNTSTTGGIELLNNIIQVTRTGTGSTYSIYHSTAAGATATLSNYNDLVGSGSNYFVGYNGSNQATLADWQAATSQDANSVSVVPGFVSLNNLTPSNQALDGAGQTIATVTTDFNQVTRQSPPDIGAVEFMVVSRDLGATALVAPAATQGCYGAAEPIVVTVRNYGTAALNFATNPATVTVVVTPPTGAAQTFTQTVNTGTLATGTTQNVTLPGMLNMTALGTYTFDVTATVTGDQNTTNDMIPTSPTRTKVAPTAGTLSPATTTVCTGGTATLNLSGSDNGDIQFQSSASASGPFTNVSMGTGGTTATYTTGTLTQTTYFQAVTSCGTLTATSNVSTITVNNPQPVSTNAPQTICAGNTATLTATGNTGQTFQFFDMASGGTPLTSTTGGTAAAPTASFTTPALTANTTYYVETTGSNNETAGRPAPTSGTAFGNASNYGLIFDVLAPTTLQSVTVVSIGGSGPITIEVQNASGTMLATATGTVAAGTTAAPVPSVITLNFALSPGTDYRLTQTTAVSLVRENGVGGYPYNSSGGSVSITSGLLSGAANANNYYWFYDWVLGGSCTGARTALPVNVNPTPTFTTTRSNAACFGGTGFITVTAAGGTGSFEYSKDNGATYQASNTFGGLMAGTYNIQVRNLGGAQCPAAAAQAVTITAPASAVSVSATKTDATAFGAMNGTITATGMGGTSPYTYNLNGGTSQSSGNFTGLNPGTYTVNVTDVNGCTASTSITVGGPTTAPCNAPTALSAGSITNTSAMVSFSGSGSATSYTVTTSPATTTQTLPSGATSVSFTGLSASTAYTVSIRSNCAGGLTATATTTFTTQAPPCNAPTNLTAGSVTSNSATVSFTGSGSATSYTVTTTPATTTQTLGASATSVSFSGLMTNTAYTVNIVSNCAGGATSAPATASFTTGAAPCNAPTALTAGSLTNTSATVSFTGSASATGYTVTTTPATTTQTLGASATSVSFTGLTPGTMYAVNIVSNCAGGVTSSPATVSFTTTSVCNAATGLTASAITTNSATVSFTGSASATSYTVTTSPATTTQTLPAGSTSALFAGLMPSTAYTVSIRSNCAGGLTATATTTFTTATPPCNAATGLTASAITASSATVSFTGSASATSYTVTTTPATTTQTLGASATSVSFSGLMTNTAYTVNIVSNCAGGQTSAPATASFTTGAAPCNAPTALSASSVTSSSATVSFTGSASATGYTVTTTPATTTQTLGASATSVSFTGLTASTAYQVSIVSNCAGGVTSSPATVSFTTTAPAPANLTVSTTQGGISGTYNNVTITGTGNATLGGTLTVTGALTVQTGGTLNTNCQTVNGAGSFTLSTGTTLAICDPAGISASGATGAIQVTGTRSFASDASYLYNGTVAQVTGAGLPAQVRNLTVNNAANVTQTQAVAVAQLLTLTSGNLATGGQPLLLLSSAAGTAVVVNTNGVVTGTATVQRYIDPSLNPGLGYRHYSAPVANTTIADLATPTGFAPVLNPAYNTSATPSLVTPFPTVFGYDETRVGTIMSNYGPFDQGFFSPAATSAPMVVGQGYTVNIGATQLVDFVGTLNNGTQTKTGLTRGTNAQSGWHLLGNPFPSPLDVTAFSPANFSNVDNAVYVYRSTGQYVGQYTTFVNGIGTSQPVATAQGFFVRASTAGTAGSLTMPQAARVTTFSATPAFQRNTAGTRPLLQLDLSGATGTDAAYVYFEAGATSAAPEPTRDAVKLPNPTGLNLASATANGEELAINGLPLLAAQPVIVPLRLTAPVAGSYTFAVAELANFDATTVVELRDALTGTVQVLTPQARLTVTLPAGATGSRFTLVFRPGAILATRGNLDAALVNLYPNPAHGRFVVELPALTGASRVEATLLNALGQQVRSQSQALNAQGTTLEFGTENLAAGVYSLRLRAGELQVVKRVVVE